MNTIGISVRELLDIPIMKNAKIISGHAGLHRLVRYVDILEVPEVKGWLREGELLLTTAYSLRHDLALLTELVKELAQVDAAALGIKRERFLHNIPEEMIQVSNQYALPIIDIPTEIPYIDITQAVMELVLDRQAALLRRSEEVYKTLTTMVLENSGIQAVADLVSDLVKASVRVVDNQGIEIVTAPHAEAWNPQDNPLAWPIKLDKQVVGHLLIDKPSLDDMEQVCVEQAKLVFSLELMRRKTAQDTEQKMRGNFIDELLSEIPPAKHDVIRMGQQFGLNPELVWVTLLLEMKNPQSVEGLTLQKMLDHELQGVAARTHVQTRQNKLVLLLPMPQLVEEEGVTGSRPKNWWHHIVLAWATGQGLTSQEIKIGAGRAYPLWQLSTSYAEARKALAISKKMYPDYLITDYSAVEAYDLLSTLMDNPAYQNLYKQKLGKLEQYDQENNTELIRTLQAFLETGGSLIDTANRLYVHRNSVKYRMERMKEIAGIDFSSPHERFLYQLCIAYYYLR